MENKQKMYKQKEILSITYAAYFTLLNRVLITCGGKTSNCKITSIMKDMSVCGTNHIIA